MNEQLTIDLKAVAYAKFYYTNQDGSKRRTKPLSPTVHGVSFSLDSFAPSLHSFPRETNMERALRLEVLDTWTPCCQYALRNNYSLVFRGEKAKQMWKTYNNHIYGKR